MPKGNLTKEEKEKLRQAQEVLGDLGYKLVEDVPYDKAKPETDRRKSKDRRKPVEPEAAPKKSGWDFLK